MPGDKRPPTQRDVLYRKASDTLGKIEKWPRRVTGLSGHFTWRFPKYHDGPFEMDCPAVHTFRSETLDMTVLALQLFPWQNEHVACEPKDTPHE